MQEGKTNFTIRMDKSKRDEWKEVAEESEQFGTLSQLVRFAVDQEVQRIRDRQEGEPTKEEKEVIDKIENESQFTRRKVDDMIAVLEDLQDNILTVGDAEAMTQNQTYELKEEFNNE